MDTVGKHVSMDHAWMAMYPWIRMDVGYPSDPRVLTYDWFRRHFFREIRKRADFRGAFGPATTAMRFSKGATRAEVVAAIMEEHVSVAGVEHTVHWCRNIRTRHALSGTEIFERSTGRVLVFESEERDRVGAYIRAHAPKHFTADRQAELRSLLHEYNRAHLPAVSEYKFLRTYCATCGVSAVQAAARKILAEQRKAQRTKQKAAKAARNKRNAEQAALAGERQRRKLSAAAAARPHSANIAGARDIAPTLRRAVQAYGRGRLLFVCG